MKRKRFTEEQIIAVLREHDGDGVVVNGQPVNDASGDDGEDDGIKPLPDRLVFDLTAQRTLALRNALAGDVNIAIIAALHAFVLQVFYRFAPNTCLEISMKSGSFSQVDGLAETSWAKEVAERHEAWDRDLPDEAEGLWDFLLGLDEASRKALFAHCISLTLNAVVEPWNRRAKALDHADALCRSLQFDMVDAGWTPTVEFLGRLTKARILQAVREARSADSAQLIDHMKKDIMAREAARLLEGSNWLPEPLRLEVDQVAADAGDAAPGNMSDEATLDGDAAELPAFLADDADPSSDKPVTFDGDETDQLQAAE